MWTSYVVVTMRFTVSKSIKITNQVQNNSGQLSQRFGWDGRIANISALTKICWW